MILNSLRRLRHSRGFGVHSPFGFRFVKSVLRPARGYAYYAEEELANRLSSYPKRIRRDALRLFRVLAFMNPGKIFVPQSAGEEWLLPIKCLSASSNILRGPGHLSEADCALTTGDLFGLPELSGYIRMPGKTLLMKNYHRETLEAVFDKMKEGIMFEGTQNAILISVAGMRKVRYLMNF